MTKTRLHAPETPATRILKLHKLEYSVHLYTYEPHGGTAVSARELQLNEHHIIKTLIMQDENSTPLIVLMHGDRKVSTKALARQIGVKRVEPCAPEVASRHTGYLIGGTSPFGTRRPMKVYAERSILSLTRLYINGGRRGFLVGLNPDDLMRILQPVAVDATSE